MVAGTPESASKPTSTAIFVDSKISTKLCNFKLKRKPMRCRPTLYLGFRRIVEHVDKKFVAGGSLGRRAAFFLSLLSIYFSLFPVLVLSRTKSSSIFSSLLISVLLFGHQYIIFFLRNAKYLLIN